jgi:hypothetical protein
MCPLIPRRQYEGLKREALDKVLANYLFTEKNQCVMTSLGLWRPALLYASAAALPTA